MSEDILREAAEVVDQAMRRALIAEIKAELADVPEDVALQVLAAAWRKVMGAKIDEGSSTN